LKRLKSIDRMHPVLQQTYAALSRELEGLDLSATQAHPRGDASAWSVQQVIEHLLATYATCTASLDGRLAKGRPLESPLSFRLRFWQWVIIDVGYFPPGRKAPEPVRPGVVTLAAQDGAGLAQNVRAALSKLDAALDRVHAVYPSRPVVTHIVLGPLTVCQWRRFHRVHARHHAKQLIRVKAATASGSSQ
jgi:hypothetical protein